MPKVAVYNTKGEQVGDIELKDEVFGVEVNEPLVHQAIVRYLANQRQGTVATKTRGEVRGGGRKPWRQKGTGRARHGSIRSPIWVGGGTTFGPQPRDYRQAMPKKAAGLPCGPRFPARWRRVNCWCWMSSSWSSPRRGRSPASWPISRRTTHRLFLSRRSWIATWCFRPATFPRWTRGERAISTSMMSSLTAG